MLTISTELGFNEEAAFYQQLLHVWF
jgi:hypothetical protein